MMGRLQLYRLALGQPNPDSYLRTIEKNGFLKSIDTRSLYLNLFPFHTIDRDGRLGRILQREQSFGLLLADAENKATVLERGTGRAVLRRLVGKAVAAAQKKINGDYAGAVKRPPLRRLVGAILGFVDIHDEINDRVPVLGYQDDLGRLKRALAAMT